MSNDTRKGSRQLLEEFIKCYQSEPCLWNTQSKEYHDKTKKQVAYTKLLRIYKLLEPRADRITVVKKINILRTNHRKEKKKVKESERAGNGIYVPKLWYYHLFDFLENQNKQTNFSNINEKDDSSADQQIGVYVEDISESQDTNSSNGIQEVHSPSNLQQTKTAFIRDHLPYLTPQDLQISSKKTIGNLPKRSPPDGEGNGIREQEHNSKKRKWGDDRYQIFSTNVTLKMKDIRNDTQRLLAEKIINEALFMAEMGQLSMSHAICLNQNYYNPKCNDYSVGSSGLSFHNSSNRRSQTSTIVAKNEMAMTSPDCTSDYENEDYQRFNCQNCGQRDSCHLKNSAEPNDPLGLLLPKN